MEVGSLVKHWRTKEAGIIVAKKTFTREYIEWKVGWLCGDWGYYSPDRLVEVVCK